MANYKRSKRSGPVARRPLVEPEDFYEAELPDLKKYQNGAAWACCPFHDDTHPSFSVNLETGAYRCYSSSCEAAGPNIVSFVSTLYAFKYSEALQYLEAHYG